MSDVKGIRKNQKLNRKATVTAYFEPELKEILEKKCEKELITISTYLRNKVHGELMQFKKDNPELFE